MMSPPMEEVMRKVRRALDPVGAIEGMSSTLKAYRQKRIRLRIMIDNNIGDDLKQGEIFSDVLWPLL